MSERWWLIAAGVLFAGTVAIGWKLGEMNNAARAGELRHAFADLQSVTTEEQATSILQTWKDAGAKPITDAMKLDLVFPFFYATLVALACLRAATRVQRRWVAVLGMVAAALAVAGGVFDLLENGKMLKMVEDLSRAEDVGTLVLFKRLKEGLSMLALSYVILVPFAWLRK